MSNVITVYSIYHIPLSTIEEIELNWTESTYHSQLDHRRPWLDGGS